MDDKTLNETLDEWKKINFVNGKPVDSASRIVKVIMPCCGEANHVRARRQVSFSQEGSGDVLLLTQGYAFVYRNDGICMGVVAPPSVLGILGAYHNFYNQDADPEFYMLTASDCIYYRCDQRTFVELIETNNLWHDIARILAARLSRVERNNRELMVSDTRRKVSSLLVELSMYPEEVCGNITMLEFVQQRTNLSRSIIMKIISEFKRANVISTSRGRLISVDMNKLDLAHLYIQ